MAISDALRNIQQSLTSGVGKILPRKTYDMRQTYEQYVHQTRELWGAAGRPMDMLMPTWKTLATKRALPRPWLLRGQIPNIRLKHAPEGTQQDDDISEPSLLETACGLAGDDTLTIAVARVGSFMSEAAVDEANDIGCAVATMFTMSGALELLDEKVFSTKKNFLMAERELAALTEGKDDAFLATFIAWSMRTRPIASRPSELIVRNMMFWIGYGAWRGME